MGRAWTDTQAEAPTRIRMISKPVLNLLAESLETMVKMENLRLCNIIYQDGPQGWHKAERDGFSMA